MKERLASARRVLDVQLKLQQIAELKLAELRSREQELFAEEADLVRYLSGESPLAGVLSSSLARRLRKNGQNLLETRQAKASEEKALLDRAARAKLSERMVERLDLDLRRTEERSELGDLVERFLARSSASFP